MNSICFFFRAAKQTENHNYDDGFIFILCMKYHIVSKLFKDNLFFGTIVEIQQLATQRAREHERKIKVNGSVASSPNIYIF